MATITVLGPVTVADAGPALSPRDRKILAVLVARRAEEVSSEMLAEALWGEDLPASWAKVVQGCIARLRRRLGADAIITGHSGYRLAVPTEDVDAGRFERLVSRARELAALGHSDQAAYAADEALALWHGRALADLEDWEPGRGEAIRLDELRLLAQELRMTALLASGRHREVLAEAALRVREQPLRENRWALLARAQYQDGRQAEALGTLRRAREVLAEELGLDPGSELVELERAVLQQDPDLTVAEATLTSAACPWPGLAAYDVDDADAFFGRGDELEQCLQRLARHGFLAVVGPSGSGKSSLVRAGLAAHLRAEGHSVSVIVPAVRPLDELAAVVRSRVIPTLVVDQFEELFTSGVAEETRAEFIAGVAEQVGLRPVVVTLRADRLGELAAYPAIARLVEDGLYLLKAMGRESLCAAIEQPARRAGLLLEQGLVDLLVRDVEGEPGSLPLLAHALRETWARREGNTLTVEGYRASGGIRGAVAQSAESIYQQASDPQRAALRELHLRMVQTGPAGDPVRTSVDRHAVTADPEHAVLVERLVRARLFTVERDRVAIAHEALAVAWPRLQSWLSDDVEGERIRHHLAATADGWEAMGRPESELYRGARLVAAREWKDSGEHRLNSTEQEFLDASESRHHSRLVLAEEEARRQHRVNRRLRGLVVGVAVLALVAAGFGVVARLQWRQSQEAQAVASAEASRAVAHGLSATAMTVVDRDPSLAKALAIVAAQSAPPSPQSLSALHLTLAADRIVSRVSMNHFTNRLMAVLNSAGTLVAMSGENAQEPALAIEVHDARTGDLVWEWVRPDQPGFESAFAAGVAWVGKGDLLAGGVVWNPHVDLRLGGDLASSPQPPEGVIGIHLWDPASHQEVRMLDVGPCGGWPLKASSDKVLVRRLVAPADATREEADSIVRECRWSDGDYDNVVFDLATGDVVSLGTTPSALGWFKGVALSGDGSVGAVAQFTSDGLAETVLRDTTTGAEIRRLPGMPSDLDPEGEKILVQLGDGVVEWWVVASTTDGSTVSTYRGHSARSHYGTFSADGTTVLTTATDHVLVEWDVEDALVLRRIPGTGEGRPSGALDGQILVPRPVTYGSVLVEGRVPGETWSAPRCGPDRVQGTGYADQLRVASGRVLVGRDCGAAQGPLESFAVGGSDAVRAVDANWGQGIAVSPSGGSVVTQVGTGPFDRGDLEIRDTTTLEVTGRLPRVCRDQVPCPAEPMPFALYAWSIVWSADGRWIVAVDPARGAVVWDVRTREVVAVVAASGSPDVIDAGLVMGALFTPAGDNLIIGTQGSLLSYDTTTWELTASAPAAVSNFVPGLIGFAADGTMVVVSPFGQNTTFTSVLMVDPESLEVRAVWPNITAGSVRAAHVSPDGTRLALATSEGTVDVWNLSSGSLVDRADPAMGSIQGVQWLDDRDLVLLSRSGEVLAITTDPDRLQQVARASLTRGLTPTECAGYGLVPCPDLVTLRGDEPNVPDELRGSYSVTWTAEELAAAARRYFETAFDTELDERSLEEIDSLGADFAGDYRLELRDASYEITRDGDVWCTGAVTTSAQRPDRLLLGAEGGSWCLDFHYAEIGWRLDAGELSLPRETFRGSDIDAVVWTSKPLGLVSASDAPGDTSQP